MEDKDKTVAFSTEFIPKLEPLVLLTVIQLAIPLIPGSFGLGISSLLLFLLNPITDYNLKTFLLATLCFNFSGIILIIFSEYIFVSKWISHIMNNSTKSVNNVSFGLLYGIIKQRLMFMCGFGILLIVTGFITLIISCMLFFTGRLHLIIFALPVLVLIGAFLELISSELE